jgi:NAD(P)H dehydrogenase (quinone)
MTTVIVTGAAGDTGRPCVERLLEKGLNVRALVRTDDARAQRLRDLGAQVVLGDMMSLRDIRIALDGAQRAYFCYPLAEGLVEAAVIFAQAAKEQQLELIVNNSHKQSRPAARSKATQNHWLSEQVFDWSGVTSTHLRITFFQEWLLYIAPLIRHGRYVMPYDASSRFAPIAGADIARVVAGIIADPVKYGGKTIPLHGPIEYSHEELAAEVGRVLGRPMPYERLTVTTFLDLFGLQNDAAKLRHFEAVTIDQQEGLLAGTDSLGAVIAGQALMKVEDFIKANQAQFELKYPLASASH